jgi:outer membrane protein
MRLHDALAPMVLVAFAATAARAADATSPMSTEALAAASEQPNSSTWRVTLRATGYAGPKFEGAKDLGFSGYPGLSIQRPGQAWRFSAPDDGFGLSIVEQGSFAFGPVARFRPERDSSDEKRVSTLRDVEWTIEPGAFAELYLGRNVRLRGELRHGVHGHNGFVGDVAADWIERSGAFTVAVGPRLALGDASFMNEYFGVSAAEAARGQLGRYKANGGVKSVGLAGSVSYDWTPNWSTTAFGGYDRMTGDAAKSPVVRTLDSRNQVTVGVSAAYSFDWR